MGASVYGDSERGARHCNENKDDRNNGGGYQCEL